MDYHVSRGWSNIFKEANEKKHKWQIINEQKNVFWSFFYKVASKQDYITLHYPSVDL